MSPNHPRSIIPPFPLLAHRNRHRPETIAESVGIPARCRPTLSPSPQPMISDAMPCTTVISMAPLRCQFARRSACDIAWHELELPVTVVCGV